MLHCCSSTKKRLPLADETISQLAKQYEIRHNADVKQKEQDITDKALLAAKAEEVWNVVTSVFTLKFGEFNKELQREAITVENLSPTILIADCDGSRKLVCSFDKEHYTFSFTTNQQDKVFSRVAFTVANGQFKYFDSMGQKPMTLEAVVDNAMRYFLIMSAKD
jgi:hypothetical protein